MVERRIKAAKFPTVKSLDSFDFAALPSCPANELVADIHDRMPVIIPPESYDHWLSTLDPDPRGLFCAVSAEADEDMADQYEGEQTCK